MQRRLNLATLFATRARSSSRSRHTGPPWILGWQGSPLEAPAHSIVGCERALELGLDGFAVQLHRTRDDGLVAGEREDLGAIAHVAQQSRAELSVLDVGALYSARFRGLGPAFAEDFASLAAAKSPRRWILVLDQPGSVALVRELFEMIPPGLRIASRDPDTVRTAAQQGFAALYMTSRVDAREITALCAGKVTGLLMALSDWRTTLLQEWPACERWTRADHPVELEAALRAGFEGILTSEPLRAQALHELVQLTPGKERAFPLELPRLLLEPAPAQGWMGSFEFMARVKNPLAVPVQVTLGILPRMGAFSIQGLPQALYLEPGEHAEVPVRISGGARQPGADPLLFALLRTSSRRALLLDGPLERVRIVPADPLPLRVPLLGDSPGRARRTLLVRRHRQQLLVSLEGGRELEELRIEVRLGEHLHAGVRGVRVQLPADWDRDADGIAIAVRVSWMEAGERREARLCGGLPEGPRSGAPARLVPLARA